MSAWYNDVDPDACAWLEGLTEAGDIASGVVDERSIHEVQAQELEGHDQCHFFAGIGGWSLGLRIAGWPDDFPVWTGSCPCQPFSCTGKGLAADDERHLAPAWLELIEQCRPPVLFGEQVASFVAREWFSDLRIRLEAMGYAVGGADLCAAGIGAPHVRQRLYFGAVRLSDPPGRQSPGAVGCGRGPSSQAEADVRPGSVPSLGEHPQPELDRHWAGADWHAFRDGRSRPSRPGAWPVAHGIPGAVDRVLARGYGNAVVPQLVAAFVRSFVQAVGDLEGGAPLPHLLDGDQVGLFPGLV